MYPRLVTIYTYTILVMVWLQHIIISHIQYTSCAYKAIYNIYIHHPSDGFRYLSHRHRGSNVILLIQIKGRRSEKSVHNYVNNQFLVPNILSAKDSSPKRTCCTFLQQFFLPSLQWIRCTKLNTSSSPQLSSVSVI